MSASIPLALVPVMPENGRGAVPMSTVEPGPQYPLFPLPRASFHVGPRYGPRDVLLVLLLMAVTAGTTLVTVKYEDWQHQQALASGEPAGDGTLSLPAEVRVQVGEPQELLATTRGRRVVWMSLDRELVLKPASQKSVWVWGNKPGTYRLIAWSAVDGMPTMNATTIVTVEQQKEGSTLGSAK